MTHKGIYPVPSNVQSIKEFPEPKDKKELGRFLGMVNFYGEFIKDMAELAEPLNRLRREGQPFEWDAVCKTAFRSYVKP